LRTQLKTIVLRVVKIKKEKSRINKRGGNIVIEVL
jgi:hypothetical protein